MSNGITFHFAMRSILAHYHHLSSLQSRLKSTQEFNLRLLNTILIIFRSSTAGLYTKFHLSFLNTWSYIKLAKHYYALGRSMVNNKHSIDHLLKFRLVCNWKYILNHFKQIFRCAEVIFITKRN